MSDKIDPKVGDRVTIWARVTAVEPDLSGERFYRVKIEGAEYLDAVGLYALRIAFVAPAPLAVAERGTGNPDGHNHTMTDRFCKDCKHARRIPWPGGGATYGCLKIHGRDPVTGEDRLTDCTQERIWGAGGCGPEGKLWEAK